MFRGKRSTYYLLFPRKDEGARIEEIVRNMTSSKRVISTWTFYERHFKGMVLTINPEGTFTVDMAHCDSIQEQECIPVGSVPSAAVAISGGGICPGVSAQGVSAWRGVCRGAGVSQHAMGHIPPCGQTDTCKNITFPHLLLRTVVKNGWATVN